MGRRSSPLTRAVVAGAVGVALLKISEFSFVGAVYTASRGGLVAREVGVDYLLRNGPRDVDPPLIDTRAASGATHEVTYKKRPFGIKRYAPGADGTGAVIMDITEKSRYPGDPQGQAAVAGVGIGWVVKSINGNPVDGIKFEDIMEGLDDEVLDPVEALSLNLKEAGVSTTFTDMSHGADKSYGPVGQGTFVFGGGNKAELPITVVYQEQGSLDGAGMPATSAPAATAASTSAGASSPAAVAAPAPAAGGFSAQPPGAKDNFPILGLDI